jgi:hypothetical protein
MIESLTAEQEALLPVYRDKWLKIGLSTEPANLDKLIEGAGLAYEEAKLKMPKDVHFAESPLAGVILATRLKKKLPSSVKDKDVLKEHRKECSDQLSNMRYGPHDAPWLAFCDYCGEVLKVEGPERLKGLSIIAQNGGWWAPYDTCVIFQNRHNKIVMDEQHRLHNLEGSAISYPDGFSVFAVHGVRVPEWFIAEPRKITVKTIDEERNAEYRRILVELYEKDRGKGAFMKAAGGEIIDDDEAFGRLWRRTMPNSTEPMLMVEVMNPTVENGIRRTFFLDVSGKSRLLGWPINTAKQAVAATWNKRENEIDFPHWLDRRS